MIPQWLWNGCPKKFQTSKPLGSTEALWHPLKEPGMSESTESIEME